MFNKNVGTLPVQCQILWMLTNGFKKNPKTCVESLTIASAENIAESIRLAFTYVILLCVLQNVFPRAPHMSGGGNLLPKFMPISFFSRLSHFQVLSGKGS